MPSDIFLALDQGGHASRAMLFDSGGRMLDDFVVAIETRRPAPDRVEHDAEEIVASLSGAVAGIANRNGALLHRIAAAGIATQRSSIVCWDRETGEALSPVISWQDRRHAAWLKQFHDRSEWVRAQTGLPLSPHYGASKMRWCLDHEPAVQSAQARGRLAIGPLASFVLSRLLAERPFVVDPANASRTQLWDPAELQWSEPLCSLFGIDRALLPRCVGTRHAFGTLRCGAGQAPFAIATGDQSAVPFAFGEVDAATAYVNVGTGAFIQVPVPGPLPSAPRLLASVLRSDGARVERALEGTVNGGGAALDWLAAREAIAVSELLDELRRSDISRLVPPIFLNGVSGLGSPYWVSDFQSGFLGDGNRAERTLAVLESVAYLIAVNLAEIRSVTAPLQRVLVTGGMSVNDAFCATLAAVCALPVERHAACEATARGLAGLLGATTTGTSAGECRTFRPDSVSLAAGGAAPGVASRYERWISAMHAAIH